MTSRADGGRSALTFLTTLIERHRADPVASMPRLEPRIASRFEPVEGVVEPSARGRDVVIDVGQDAYVPATPLPRHTTRPRQADAESREDDGGPHVRMVTSALDAARATAAVPALAAPPRPPVAAAVAASTTTSSPAARVGTQEERRPVAEPPVRARTPFLEPVPDRRPPAAAARPIHAERDGQVPRETPTVHVSIGRVEVRAMVAPPASSPARPPSSASRPSLEDYLRGRPRGSR